MDIGGREGGWREGGRGYIEGGREGGREAEMGEWVKEGESKDRTTG